MCYKLSDLHRVDFHLIYNEIPISKSRTMHFSKTSKNHYYVTRIWRREIIEIQFPDHCWLQYNVKAPTLWKSNVGHGVRDVKSEEGDLAGEKPKAAT